VYGAGEDGGEALGPARPAVGWPGVATGAVAHDRALAQSRHADDFEVGMTSDRGAWRKFMLWHDLRSIGNSSLAKMTIVIPIVGYLVLFNEKLQDYLQLSHELLAHQQAGSSGLPRLLAIYFGLCFVAMASTLFALFCPLQVKKYATAEEYIAGDEPYLSFHGEGQIEDRIKNGDVEAKKLYADLQEYHSHRPTAENLEEVRRRGV
jgi:hypothetical protein